ncbi:MAG: DNA cytosine methyltransferase [Prolixibacteraceae bacterium]|jgi:DNA (cytosine-5)-methyltransferase 1|nr:DNA cytosine methyltransferase [Prolixibacteraceae bacterium]
MNFIDLFAGAGGLSEGFIRAGFTPIAHVEMDKAACNTLLTRTAYHQLRHTPEFSKYISYIKNEGVSRKELYNLLPDKKKESVINLPIGNQTNPIIFSKIDALKGDQTIDLIVGGPPCQAYSVVGRGALKHKEKDERKILYIQYGKFLERYQPRLFVFENVPGILSSEKGLHFDNLREYFGRLGYEVHAKLLNAYDFEVVQNRLRVIIIGWKSELNLTYPEFVPSEIDINRDDIFSDLPAISPGESARYHHYASATTKYLERTEIRNGLDFVTQHITRPHNIRDLEIYRLAIERLELGERLTNNQIPENMRTQSNIDDFLDRFKVVDQRPHTMIAHIAKDGHHYIHPYASQLRSISVREAARIQSFPDDYYFEGVKEDQPRSAAFRQIGNAVPPLMAKEIAHEIKKMLR